MSEKEVSHALQRILPVQSVPTNMANISFVSVHASLSIVGLRQMLPAASVRQDKASRTPYQVASPRRTNALSKAWKIEPLRFAGTKQTNQVAKQPKQLFEKNTFQCFLFL